MSKFSKILLWTLVPIVVLAVVAGTVLVSFPSARAQLLPFIPFGGRVLVMIPCTCPIDIGKFVIGIGPPKPIVAVYDFRFSWLTLKMWYNFTFGQKVLGLATKAPLGVCRQLNPIPPFTPPCIPTFVGPYIFLVGTTLVAPPGPP